MKIMTPSLSQKVPKGDFGKKFLIVSSTRDISCNTYILPLSYTPLLSLSHYSDFTSLVIEWGHELW